MRTVELRFPQENPAEWLAALCRTLHLKPSDPTTLASYPGSLHWHITSPGQTGTLELTWWPKGQRLWAKVASNREAPWIDNAFKALTETFESQ